MNIVQIGTCVGNDDLTNIIKNNEVNLLVLVEPMKIHNNAIYECYKNFENLHLENIAIVDDDKSEISFFFHINDGPKYEVASVYKQHIIKHGLSEDGIIECKVKCMKINHLFEKYKLNYIDILFIDAEGIDDLIIKSIDFSKYEINKIYFENLHITDGNIYETLTNLGYNITLRTGHNGWSSLAEKNTQ